MNCREIRLRFSEALDGPPGGELRRGIESHCADCAICGPEWRTLLRLELMMAEAPPPPPDFADRVMAALPPVTAPRREAMPFVAAGLLVAGGLLAFQLAYVSDLAAPMLAQVNEALRGIAEVARARASEGTSWTLSAWVAGAAAAAGALGGAAILKARQTTN